MSKVLATIQTAGMDVIVECDNAHDLADFLIDLRSRSNGASPPPPLPEPQEPVAEPAVVSRNLSEVRAPHRGKPVSEKVIDIGGEKYSPWEVLAHIHMYHGSTNDETQQILRSAVPEFEAWANGQYAKDAGDKSGFYRCVSYLMSKCRHGRIHKSVKNKLSDKAAARISTVVKAVRNF
jgi:hypothetical protein